MNKTYFRAFTLIELLISITIFFILALMAFAPYRLYINKAKVQYTNKELSQIIYEAKNMAKNGSVSLSGNISMGVYFDTNNSEKNKYKLYSFPYNVSTLSLSLSDGNLLQTYYLQPDIQIDSFHGESKGMVFFQSISGTGMVFTGDNFQVVDTDNEIQIDYSYKGSTNPVLKNSLIYFQDTQIIDY